MINKIKELSWTVVEQRIKENPLVIIPTGAVEVYGPHMPLGTDSIVAEAMAEIVADNVNALIAPNVEMGESSSLVGFPGTIAMSMQNYHAYMENLLQNLIRQGFKKFLFLNGHGGNVAGITYLSKKYQREYGIKCALVDVWTFVEKHGDDIFECRGAMAHGHAAESNTSIMLYIRPELVNMDKAKKVEPKTKNFADITQYQTFESMTELGIIGDPTIATAEKGKAIMEKCTKRIIDFIKEEF